MINSRQRIQALLSLTCAAAICVLVGACRTQPKYEAPSDAAAPIVPDEPHNDEDLTRNSNSGQEQVAGEDGSEDYRQEELGTRVRHKKSKRGVASVEEK